MIHFEGIKKTRVYLVTFYTIYGKDVQRKVYVEDGIPLDKVLRREAYTFGSIKNYELVKILESFDVYCRGIKLNDKKCILESNKSK